MQQQLNLDAPIRLRPVKPLQLGCKDCPLDKAPLIHPKMPPTGSDHPVFYFLGEAPGRNEDEVGEQFIGESGRIIRDRIPSKFRPLIRWNNTIRCRPPENRDPEDKESACCRRLQVADIEATKPQIIVGFGKYPLNWIINEPKERAITDWRGRKMPVKIGNHVCWFYSLVHPAMFLHQRSKEKTEPAMRAFERDLKRMFADYTAGLPQPDVEDKKHYLDGIHIVTQWGQRGVDEIVALLKKASVLADSTIDIETNRLRPYSKDTRIISTAIGTYQSTFAFCLEHRKHQWKPAELKTIYKALLDYLKADNRKWAHYAKFEQEWFTWKYGPDALFEVRWHDTAALAHALDERKGKALEDLTLQRFGFNVKLVSSIDRSRIDEFELSDVLPYNGMDTKYQDGIRVLLQEDAEQMGVGAPYAELNRMNPSFVMMQRAGVVPDLDAIQTLTKQLTKKEADLQNQIQEDKDVKKFITAYGKFKPSSNKDMVMFFRDFLKVPHPNQQGRKQEVKYSLTADILEQINHPIAEMVVELRTTVKNLNTYVVPMAEEYRHDDGLAHASFSHLITVTGRSACEDPPLQQFPRREHKEIRRVIGAPEGHIVASFDFGQLEARVIGMVSKDRVLMKEIFDGYDIHGDWTDQLGKAFRPDMLQTKEKRKHLRDYIKNKWTFPLFFGSRLESVAYDLSRVFEKEVHPNILAEHYDGFWDKYSGVRKWQEEQIAFYWKFGYVETLTGFRRREPMTQNELINQPIQGTAGHIVIDAQVRLSEFAYRTRQPRFQPHINIHDDLTFYLPKSKTLDTDIELIAKYMCVPSYQFLTVPLTVEVSIGPNFADKEELTTFSSVDFGWKPPKI